MNTPPTTVQQLHEAYVKATGFNLRLDMCREAMWWDWVKRGLTPQDVETLVRNMKWRQDHGLSARSLVFRWFVGRPDWAEEDLMEIRARSRGKCPQPNRESVLRATGRVAPDGQCEPMQAVASKEIVEAALLKLREAVGMRNESHP